MSPYYNAMWKIQWADKAGLRWDLRGFYLSGNYCVPLTLRLWKNVCMCGRNCVFPADFTILLHTQAHLHMCAYCHSRSLTDTSKYANASISKSETAWKDKLHWKIASLYFVSSGVFTFPWACVRAPAYAHVVQVLFASEVQNPWRAVWEQERGAHCRNIQ